MRRLSLTIVLVAALVPAAALAAGTPVRTTLTGTCTSKNSYDHNDVITKSVVTCTAKATCSCPGKTHLVYDSVWTSPGTGAAGPDRSKLTATTATSTATLNMKGTRDGTGQGKGTWTLGTVTGLPRSRFLAHGTYTLIATTPGTGLGPTTPVRVSAVISCWHC